MREYLEAGEFVDSDHPDVRAFAERTVGDAASDRERVVRLFYAVRDGIRYDPYNMQRDRAAFRASRVVSMQPNWCVPKAILLTAAARVVGVPARLGFADVRNHLQSAKLKENMGTDLFVWHGYSEFWLGERWLKASSAFNIELCERFGTLPLDFDGEHDALMHAFDASGNRHMEYVRQRGSYTDLPFEEMMATFDELYKTHSSLTNDPVHDELFHGAETQEVDHVRR